MKRRKVLIGIMAFLVLVAAAAIGFGAGRADAAVKATQMQKWKAFGLYDGDTLIDDAYSYQVEDPVTHVAYFAHTEAVPIMKNGQLKYKNVLIIDSPRYWDADAMVVVDHGDKK